MLVELLHSMLQEKSLPKRFWADALSIAVHVRNRLSTRGLTSNATSLQVFPSVVHRDDIVQAPSRGMPEPYALAPTPRQSAQRRRNPLRQLA